MTELNKTTISISNEDTLISFKCNRALSFTEIGQIKAIIDGKSTKNQSESTSPVSSHEPDTSTQKDQYHVKTPETGYNGTLPRFGTPVKTFVSCPSCGHKSDENSKWGDKTIECPNCHATLHLYPAIYGSWGCPDTKGRLYKATTIHYENHDYDSEMDNFSLMD